MEKLKDYIRTVPDFPKKGINFYDITTLLLDKRGLRLALDQMQSYIHSRKPDKIVAIEARGFLFGAALADRLDIGLAIARKPGKLPSSTITEEYALEYGTDSIAIHNDAVSAGERIVVVDDLIATGGTLQATCKLVERLSGEVVGISAVVALPFLPYEDKLTGYNINYLLSYDSE